MIKKYKFVFLALLIAGALFFIVSYLRSADIAVLNPKGIIADKERHLMYIVLLLGITVVIPVFMLLFAFAWRYREGNTTAKYTPDWDHNRFAETIWWGFPCAIILILSIITWNTSHDLDPFKPLASTTKPITIQVIALQWKWLFIYPEQRIASVNYVQFPKSTPVNFYITADAPMNSFWIPQLGGQVYAMAGMTTQLHLMATDAGTFKGSSANLSGRGFADMRFTAQASSTSDFRDWVNRVKQSPTRLSAAEYQKLASPSEGNKQSQYSWGEQDLYDTVVMKYMTPSSQMQGDAIVGRK